MGGLQGGGQVLIKESTTIECALPQQLDPLSRVIQAQGKFDSNMFVKNWCKWIRKMEIAQNL